MKVYKENEAEDFTKEAEKRIYAKLDHLGEDGHDLNDFVIIIEGLELHIEPGADNFEILCTAATSLLKQWQEDNKPVNSSTIENCGGSWKE
jgi:hypothetical protein